LMERQLGRGRVLVWTSTLDGYWNDLALKPVYLPFVHQSVRYLANYRETKPWFTVGQVADLAGVVSTGAEAVATSPSGSHSSLAAADKPALLALPEQGFYEVRNPRAATAAPFPVAANVDLAEADLTPMDPDELASAVVGHGVETTALDDQATQLTPEDR